MDEHAYMQSQQTTYVIERKSRTKRQKVSQSQPLIAGEAIPLESPDAPPFMKLLAGKEPEELVKYRYNMYLDMIHRQDEQAAKILADISTQTLKDIRDVIQLPLTSMVDTVLLLSNSSVAASSIFLAQMKTYLCKDENHRVVTLNSKEATTMRLALKAIVNGIALGDAKHVKKKQQKRKKAMDLDDFDDEDDEDDDDEIKTFDKRVPWDLEVAQEWCQNFWDNERADMDTSDLRLVVVLEDVDSFNVSLLNKLIKLIHAFANRIPVRLVFNISTNAQSFATKLTNEVIQCLNFHKFKIEQTDTIINKIVTEVVIPEEYLIGEQMASFILERSKMSVKNVDEFLKILKYAKMTFCFNNPLIALPHVLKTQDYNTLDQSYYKALRMLPSFMRYVSVMVDKGVPQFKVKALLRDNSVLSIALEKATKLYGVYADGFRAIFRLVTEVLAKRSYKTTKNFLDFYYRLSSREEYVRIHFINEMLSLMKTLGAESINTMMTEIGNLAATEGFLGPLYSKLKANVNLLSLINLDNGDGYAEKLNYKIEARKANESFISVLRDFLRKNITSPDRIVFHELFRINDFDVVSQNLAPATRAIIQNSLINYEEYLDSSTTGHEVLDRLDSATNPVIADLYSIYRETNLMLNIYDYYTSFKHTLDKDQFMKDIDAILDDKDKVLENYLKDDLRFKYIYQFFNNTEMTQDEKWDRLTLTLFLQKCEELVTCGFFKQMTKKKADQLEKAIWKDL